jgi:hypothetical protein
MSNLIKPVPLHLTPTDFVALEASKTQKIAIVKKVDGEKSLKNSIQKTFVIMGHSFEVEQLVIFTDCLWDELKKSQNYYTLEEIDLALEMGAKGKLCDLTKIPQPIVSLSNFLHFIRLYNEKVRREALAKDEEEKTKLEKLAEEALKKEKVKAFEAEICEVYNQYCESFGEMPELTDGLKSSYCRHLFPKNIIELTVEQEAEIFEKATKRVPVENDKKRNPFEDRVFLKKKRDAQIQDLAEAIGLEYLFMEYLKAGINLEEKLTETDKRK